jgi:chromosome segregation ATPase
VARGAAAAERASIEETISNADDMVMKLETEHKACESLVLEAQTQLDILNAALNERKAKAANLSRRFAETKAKLAALAKSADADAVARKQLEHKMSRAAKASEDTEASLARLHEDHPWVESESHLFGNDGG